ncbi:CrcB family protein [Homoserinimonas sp. OAct 916]|uniref:fluoride efflux transporter FluC n=1 Tax=Homoserinimonas sp. OAct 916 TaxID=2211450 RepID=UPI000DBE0427|nr:CrcB family protein [Homoserinimonas sp. OAct 916]
MTPRRTPPAHRHWGNLGLVALGGILGTAGREALGLMIPAAGPVPVAIATINVIGAFLLAFLLGRLARRSAGDVTAHRLRLAVGTGALGGFTTYSAFATDTVLLIVGDNVGLGLAYAFGTLILGVLATWAGLLCAGLLGPGTRTGPTLTGGGPR